MPPRHGAAAVSDDPDVRPADTALAREVRRRRTFAIITHPHPGL